MKRQYYIALILLAVACPFFCDKARAQVTPSVSIEGEVLRPLRLSIEALSAFSLVEVRAKDKDGQEHVFKGVKLYDILDSAGVTFGKQLRGENLLKYVLVTAQDGYKVFFSLPEIDPDFTNQTILLAYQVDGKPLPKGEGPFRLVVPNDKKHARWIREINVIKIIFIRD